MKTEKNESVSRKKRQKSKNNIIWMKFCAFLFNFFGNLEPWALRIFGNEKTYFSDQKLFIFIEFNLQRRCIIQITRSLYIYPCSCTVPSITVINLRSLRLYFCFMVVPYTGCSLYPNGPELVGE